MTTISAPTPDLRIVMTSALHPHEETDSQRLHPLIERIRSELHVINPPVVASMGVGADGEQFVVLDGANRSQAFSHLQVPHILAQVVSYDSGAVQLETWQHVVCNWSADALISRLVELPGIELLYGEREHVSAQVYCRDGRVFALRFAAANLGERNAALRQVVAVYQRSAVLQRTALTHPPDVWDAYVDGAALVVFPPYQPQDIVDAARYKAYLPPGISRHIVHGRALRVNYPLEALRDSNHTLDQKNEALRHWLHDRIANRQMRYYAETTYLFDE
jgi:hypothetical protein